MAYAHSSAPRAGKDTGKRGVQVVVRARPTSRFAHGSLMLNPELSKIDLKLDPGDYGVVNNVNTSFSFKYHKVRLPRFLVCCIEARCRSS